MRRLALAADLVVLVDATASRNCAIYIIRLGPAGTSRLFRAENRIAADCAGCVHPRRQLRESVPAIPFRPKARSGSIFMMFCPKSLPRTASASMPCPCSRREPSKNGGPVARHLSSPAGRRNQAMKLIVSIIRSALPVPRGLPPRRASTAAAPGPRNCRHSGIAELPRIEPT